MCEKCEEKKARVQEKFPQMLMLEKALSGVMDFEPDKWEPFIEGFSDMVSEVHGSQIITHCISHSGMSPRDATEFFGSLMFKYGLAVGAGCRETLGDHFGTYEPAPQEEADAEWERRRQNTEENLPGVAASEEALQILRDMGVPIPEGFEPGEIRIMTSKDLLGSRPVPSEETETGKESEAPGMYL